MRIKPRKGAWILGVLFSFGIIFPYNFTSIADASGEQGDTVTFSYDATTIHQEDSVDTSGKTENTATERAAQD